MSYSSPTEPNPTATLYKRWFRPMNLRLRLVTNSPEIAQAAETSFGRFGATTPNRPPDLSFDLFAHNRAASRLQPPVFRREGALLYQTAGAGATLAAHLDNGQAFGYFSLPALKDPAYFRWHFLELAFFQLLEGRGWMGLHASALANNDRAVLLRAPSGGGKTTLAFAGARSRFAALAEDVVWLPSDQARCWGMPWAFHLLPDAQNLFPELAGLRPVLQTSREMKLEVDLEQLRPGSTVTSARLAALVFVERAAGRRSRLQPVSRAEAGRLWPAAQTGLESRLPHHTAHIERLLAKPTYRLTFGDDIERALNLLEPLFDK